MQSFMWICKLMSNSVLLTANYGIVSLIIESVYVHVWRERMCNVRVSQLVRYWVRFCVHVINYKYRKEGNVFVTWAPSKCTLVEKNSNLYNLILVSYFFCLEGKRKKEGSYHFLMYNWKENYLILKSYQNLVLHCHKKGNNITMMICIQTYITFPF